MSGTDLVLLVIGVFLWLILRSVGWCLKELQSIHKILLGDLPIKVKFWKE